MNTQQQLNQLAKIEKSEKKKLDHDLKKEKKVVSLIEDITDALFVKGKCKIKIEGQYYTIGCRILPCYKVIKKDNKNVSITGHQILMQAINEGKFRVLKRKYIPATITSEYVEEMDYKANIHACVEAWVRSITNTIKASMLNE